MTCTELTERLKLLDCVGSNDLGASSMHMMLMSAFFGIFCTSCVVDMGLKEAAKQRAPYELAS